MVKVCGCIMMIEVSKASVYVCVCVGGGDVRVDLALCSL